MIVIKTITQMQRWSRDMRSSGCRIGFVPTMGFLHEGHLSLMRRARELADRVTVSIFVNPTQFGPEEDLDRYPRDFDRDEALCRDLGVDVIFYPDPAEMYPENSTTWVVEESLSAPLCGASRPSHFRGVTTVVAKLFNIVLPDVAVFGRKDAQQVLVVERMVRDLNFPVEIVSCPIVREADGLAMSSRNRYLDEAERERALSIHRGLNEALHAFENGKRNTGELVGIVKTNIMEAGGIIDYVELLDRETLKPFANNHVGSPALLAAAAFFGETRLIDNQFFA
jgi:pantoate--beta-alanine ligase